MIYLKEEIITDNINTDAESELLITTDLMFCLLHLAKVQGKGHSKRSLTAGIPLEKNKLKPDLFLRALPRISLKGTILPEPLIEIKDHLIPCILLLKDEKACYVTRQTETGFWIAQNHELSDQNNTELFIATEEMRKVYSGYALFFKPLDSETKEKSPNLSPSFKEHWLWGTLYKLRPLYYQVMIASFLTNIFALMIPLFSLNVYDRVVPNNTFSTLWVLSIGMGIVLIFDFILKVIKSHFVDTASKNADIVLSSRLLEKILGVHLSDRTLSVGELASNVKELEVIREFFSSVTLLTLIDIPFAIIFLALITYIGGIWFFITTIVFITMMVITSWMMHNIISQHVMEGFKTTNKKSGFLIETILGLETIKAFCAEGKSQHYWERLSEQNATNYRQSNFFSSLAINFMQSITNLNYVVFVIIGVYLISTRDLTMGGLIACTILGGRVIAPFAQAVTLLMRLNNVMMSYRAIDKLMSLSTERSSDRTYFPKHELLGNITFKNLSFKYADEGEQVLRDVSFQIDPLDKVAIVGKIGSGKTTLEKLIMGFYSPQSGSILFDGINAQQIDPADLRGHIGYVSQDIYLFSGTILENIMLGGGSFSPKEIEQAIVLSGTLAFIQNHPQGVNMQVGEGGRFLSGGQKQSIAIARAILHNPPILILDEPTSMMDQQSELNFLVHFKKFIDDKTVLFITHNPNLLSLANKILLLDAGKVMFYGDKQVFLEKIKQDSQQAAQAAQEQARVKTQPLPEGQPNVGQQPPINDGKIEDGT